MRHLLAVFAVACLLAMPGCKDSNKQETSSQTSSSDPKMMSTKDDCSHCAGVQTANADGKCPMCGMKVK